MLVLPSCSRSWSSVQSYQESIKEKGSRTQCIKKDHLAGTKWSHISICRYNLIYSIPHMVGEIQRNSIFSEKKDIDIRHKIKGCKALY